MKTLLTLITIFAVQASHALEWEAGIRENFITTRSYTYNSDSSARIYRDMYDRGYRRISLQPRLAYAGDQRSVFFHPTLRSSFEEIISANTRVRMADSKLTLRPLIYQDTGLGESKVNNNINPFRAENAISSYSQVVSQYLTIANSSNIDRVVVGSGIVHLLEHKNTFKKFESMLKGFKGRAGKKSSVILEITGNRDLKALSIAIENGLKIRNSIDGISLVLEPELYFPHGYADQTELRNVRQVIANLFPSTPVHLARISIPSCTSFKAIGFEYYCVNNNPDLKEGVERFKKLKETLLNLEAEGLGFDTVEVMESHTDFEPQNPDYRYPYFNPMMSSPENYELPEKAKLTLEAILPAKKAHKRLACVYYDKLDIAGIDRIGSIHAVMLESNLGSFKDWRVRRAPLSNYNSGDLSKCEAIFYIATNFMQKVPEDFMEEAAILSQEIPVVWFNYKFPEFASVLTKNLQDPGFDAKALIQPLTTPSPSNQDPGFFRFFDYKGETFHKLSEWNPLSNNFSASAELNQISISRPELVEVLSWARHSHTNEKTPYAVRSGNIWYFADSPFSFIHYEDRYFILADLLWDIMDEEAPTEKVALVRVEDVAPNTNMEGLRWAINYFIEEDIPFSLAVIPYYNDMVGDSSTRHNPVYEPITKYRELTSLLRYAKANKGAMIMHGVSHAVGSLISGYDGITGSDYEFWLYPEDTPLPFDSVDWLTKRLDSGIKVFQDLGLKPAAFEIPHYAASAMNYMVFARMFDWNYHRSIYFPFEVKSDTVIPERLSAFNCDPMKCGDERRAILENIQVDADYSQFAGVPVPYIIWRDAYGQAVIPETLGMIDFAFYDSKTWRPISKPEDVLRRAQKLKVIRGAMASFFWHPHMLNPKARYYQEVPGSYEQIGGKNSLRLVIQGLKDLGYTFKSIEDQSIFPVEHLQ